MSRHIFKIARRKKERTELKERLKKPVTTKEG
jgi:hypothetical protein